MSRFSGEQGPGARKRAKEQRRAEAEQRDEECPFWRRGKGEHTDPEAKS